MLKLFLLFTFLFNTAEAKSVYEVCETPINHTWEVYDQSVRAVPYTVRFKGVKYDDTAVIGLVGDTPVAVMGLVDMNTRPNKYRPKAHKIYKKMVRKYGKPITLGPVWLWFSDDRNLVARMFIPPVKNGPASFALSCENL